MKKLEVNLGIFKNVMVIITSLLLFGCDGDEVNSVSSSCDDSRPVIENLLINIDSWNSSDPGTAGDFILSSSKSSEKYMYAFGEYLSPSKRIPNIEFRPKVDAVVRSPVGGIITDIRDNNEEGKGYELFIRTNSNSCYLILIDHVRNVLVSKDQEVQAGDPLGIPGLYGGSSDTGQVELQVNNDNLDTHECPMSFMASDVLDNYKNLVNQFRTDVESLLGDSDAFDESLDFGNYNLCHNESILETEL